MKKTWIALGTAVLSLALIGCPPKTESNGTTQPADAGGEIVIGEYGSLTGGQATFGQSTHNGIMLAVDELNSGGGVLNGRKFRVITEDDQSKAEEAATAVTKLISQNNVIAVLGEVASSSSLAAAPICQSNKVPMITPSSTNERVTAVGDYIFRMCFIDPYQGEAMANYLAKSGMKTSAILVDVKSDYSTGLAANFKKTFVANGGKITIEQSYAQGDSDFRAQLTAIKSSNPEVIFVPGYYNDIGQIAIQARDLGMSQPLAGGDGWESPKLIEIGGKALEGSFYSNHYHVDDPAPAVRSFIQKYEERFGAKPDSLAALAYDSTMVLADALKRAGTTDGAKLRDAIAATKDFNGVTGRITLGPDRNPISKKLVVLEIKNGQLLLKESVDPTAPAATTTDSAATTTAATTTATDSATQTATPKQ
jgi:branched-chain amino acid transport system substrate-binding protein